MKILHQLGQDFFINDEGVLLTCWHVVEPALIKDLNNKIIGFNKIFILFDDTTKLEFGIPLKILSDTNLYKQAVAYDFSILVPSTKIKSKTTFLKLGNFDNAKEGQEVITCGYPIGIEQKFISKGIISTKYIDTTNGLITPYGKIKYNRNQALMDITMNKGNSGGAILLLDNIEENDMVIGIADFIINPIGGLAESLIKTFDSRSGIVQLGGIDPNRTFSDFTKILSATSIGVSGCISINHIITTLSSIK